MSDGETDLLQQMYLYLNKLIKTKPATQTYEQIKLIANFRSDFLILNTVDISM